MASVAIPAPRSTRRILGRRLIPWLFVLPMVLGLLAFALYPFLYLIVLSASESQLGDPFQEWIGLENYSTALKDAVFIDSLRRSVVFAIPVSMIELLAGVVIALLVNGSLRGGHIIRTLILLPLITPPIMVATAWKLIFNPTGGLLNSVLADLGLIDRPVSFLGSSQWALPAVALADAWQWTPFVALLAIATLQAMPGDVLQAASIDGAGRWSSFWTITFPMILPSLAAIFLIKLIITFKVFDLVYSMTFGGPGFDTNLATFQIYRVGLQQFNVGYAAAQTILFGLLVGLITLPVVVIRDWTVKNWL
ncbi:sugar ABC transporter permease [soil metagenome]